MEQVSLEFLDRELCRLVEDEAGKTYVRGHLHRYQETLSLIPTDRPMHVLDIGALLPLASVLKRMTPHSYVWHGHWTGERTKSVGLHGETFVLHNFDVEQDSFPFPNGSFDLVLCAEVLEHLGLDPLFMLGEINRVLKPHGQLLLTTPNVVSARNVVKAFLGYSPYFYASFTLNRDRHNREYSPAEVRSLLAHAGFEMANFFTRDVYDGHRHVSAGWWFAQHLVDWLMRVLRTSSWRGDAIFALARKSGPVVERYPAEFYDCPAPK
jgi:SAM-dependent methyltransferase